MGVCLVSFEENLKRERRTSVKSQFDIYHTAPFLLHSAGYLKPAIGFVKKMVLKVRLKWK